MLHISYLISVKFGVTDLHAMRFSGTVCFVKSVQ